MAHPLYWTPENAQGVLLEVLLVRDRMTKRVPTVGPGTTAGEALALCREDRIRHLPVVEGDRLVGLPSNRDPRSATPALGDPARAEASCIRVGDEMTGDDVVTCRPEEPGSRVEVALPYRPATFAGIFHNAGANSMSVLAAPQPNDDGEEASVGDRVAVSGIDTIDPGRVVENPTTAGHAVRRPPLEDNR